MGQCKHSNFGSSNQDMTRIRAVPKLSIALLYKGTSKERREKNPLTPTNLSLYTVHLSPSNHHPCFDVLSESLLIILHTTNETLVSITTPHHTTSQNVNPLPLSSKIIPPPLYNIPAPNPASCNVSAFPSHHSFPLIQSLPIYHSQPSLVT